MANKPVKIAIVGDASKFNKTMNGVSGKLSGLTGPVARLATALGGVFAVRGLVNLGTESVNLASDLEEAASVGTNVFGSAIEGINETLDESARLMGTNRLEGQLLYNQFGLISSGAGMADDEIVNFSDTMVKASVDMGSMFNEDPNVIADAWASAARGSYEPIQKYLPQMSGTYLLEYAKMNGIVDENTSTLDANTRALAIQAIAIDEDINPAIDDFSETSDGLANQQKILAAQFDNMKIAIGQKLLPAVTKLTTWVVDNMVPAFESFAPTVEAIATAVWDVVSAIADFVTENDLLLPILGAIAAAFVTWGISAAIASISTWSLAAAVAAVNLPLIAVAAAIALLVAGVIYAYRNWGWFRDAVDAVASFMTDTLWPILKDVGAWIMDTLVPIVVDLATTFWDFTTDVAGFIADLAVDIWDFVQDVIAVGKAIWDKVQDIIGFFLDLKNGILEKLGDAGTLLLDKGKAIINGLFDGIKFVWRNIVEPWLDIAGKVTGAVGNLSRILYGAGKAILNGLRDGLQWAWDNTVKPLLNTITNAIPDWKGPIDKDRKLLVENGRAIMSGLSAGLDDGWQGVTDQLGGYTASVSGAASAGMSGGPMPVGVGAGGGIVVNANTNADPYAIGREVAWVIRTGGR